VWDITAKKDSVTATLVQPWSPGQVGDRGQPVQRVAAVEDPTDIVRAWEVHLVLEIRVRLGGVTPTPAKNPL